MKRKHANGIASPAAWRSAMVADRITRAQHLKLPSGATILAVKPEPLEWILSGRIPQHLLGAALDSSSATPNDADRVMTREEILDLAWFARQLVKASVVKPAIGDGPGEIALDDIPVEDRAFIFEWACRTLKGKGETRVSDAPAHRDGSAGKLPQGGRAAARGGPPTGKEDLSSEMLERFRKE
jgi:hypothetical protein